jgi:hypothetical protein
MEEWKQLDIRSDYEVSNLGRLRRLKRSKQNKGEYTYIKGSTNGKYLQTFIRPDYVGKSNVYYIHRLVAEYFIPNVENKPEVNHKDGNKLNNSVDNLEWMTHKENCEHRELNGLANTKRDEYGRYNRY